MSLDAPLRQKATDRLRTELAETKIVRRGSRAVGVSLELDEERRILQEPSGDVKQRRAGLIVESPLVDSESQHDRLDNRPFPPAMPEQSEALGRLLRPGKRLLPRGQRLVG